MQSYYGTYFSQEPPILELERLIAEYDCSEEYELDAVAVFKTKTEDHPFLVVWVSGCSCWPGSRKYFSKSL
jgi:hypothetical protein